MRPAYKNFYRLVLNLEGLPINTFC